MRLLYTFMYRFYGDISFHYFGQIPRGKISSYSDSCLLVVGIGVVVEEEGVDSLMSWCKRGFPGPSSSDSTSLMALT